MTDQQPKKPRKGTVRDAVLAAMPGTQRQIRFATGAGISAVSRWTSYLRASAECHIGAWEETPNGGPPQCVYHAGPGADVLCTVRVMTEAEKARRKTVDGRTREKAARDRKAAELVAPAKRDPFTAAFFGPTGMA